MCHRVGTELDPGVPEFLDLAPCETRSSIEFSGGITDVSRGQKNGGGVSECAEDRKRLSVEILESVIESQHHQLFGGSSVLFEYADGLAQPDRLVIVAGKQPEVFPEYLRSGASVEIGIPVHFEVFRNTVVHQDGDSIRCTAQEPLQRVEEVQGCEAIGADFRHQLKAPA